jgi:zinc protease
MKTPRFARRAVSVALLLVCLLLQSLPLQNALAQVRAKQEPRLPSNVEFVESMEGISQYRLKSNGMTILLSPNHAAPVVTFMVVYHVGSRNEAPGNTGSTHLLEHMIFNKSTENFGKAKGHKTFQEVLYEAGADYASTNMTTWFDRMNGYSTLPSDKLEIAMKIEADRLGRALILDEERQSEMSVVRNEYEIGENDPAQALDKAVIGAAILAHPYHWSTIGYRSDIEGVSTEKLREHYKNFFWANNSEAIVVGDFNEEKALEMFDQQFGAFQRSPKPIPQVITQEPQQEGERRVVVSRPGSVGLIQLAYMRPNSLHTDFIPLDVLTNILGAGVNSRLYQTLVEKRLSTSAEVSNWTLRDSYPIVMTATVAPGITHQQVEDSLKSALYKVGREGVTEEELARAKEQIEVAVVRSRDGTYAYASSLGEAVASANWKWFLGYIDAIKGVTREDVQRVAATYLVPEHATVGWFVPEAGPAKPKSSAPPESSTKAPSGSQAVTKAAEKPIAVPAAPAGANFASRTLHRVLGNGIILDLIESHAVPTVSIQGAIVAGDAVTPQDKPALAQLTASMIERGTTKRSKQETAKLLDDAGATLAFGANTFQTTISGSLLSRDLKLVLEILADELQHPAFNADELSKAKTELKTNVLRGAENTSFRALEKLTQIVLPEAHPYRYPGKERMVASLDALTGDELRSFHKAYYNGASLILSIVGDIDAKKTTSLVDELFREMPQGRRPELKMPRTELSEGRREVVAMPGKANMNLMYGHASGLRRNDPDYEASLIANAAVGQNAMTSRIGKRVRDVEGLSYSLASRFGLTDYLDGLWYVNVAVAPANLAKALRSTREEFDKYCKEGITEAELETQKTFFAGNYCVNLGSNAGVASALVAAERFDYGPSYLDEFPERMRKVTKAEVDAAIKKHMHPDKLFLVVTGDLTTLP